LTGQHGATAGSLSSDGEGGTRIRRLAETQHLGPHIDQKHLLEWPLGARRDTTQLLDQVWGEGFELRQERRSARDQLGRAWQWPSGRESAQTSFIRDDLRQQGRVACDQVSALASMLESALVWGAVNRHEREATSGGRSA
jgi:hypothetical protein